MKKISLLKVSQLLSEKELKNVAGGSGLGNGCGTNALSVVCNGNTPCIASFGLIGVCKPYGWACACYA